MSEVNTSAAFTVEVEHRFVTMQTAATLSRYSESYIERLCRDGYVPCAGGPLGQVFPALSELLSLLKVSLPDDAGVAYVPGVAITTPALTPVELRAVSVPATPPLVGNSPTLDEGVVPDEVVPLQHAAMPVSLVEDEPAPMPPTRQPDSVSAPSIAELSEIPPQGPSDPLLDEVVPTAPSGVESLSVAAVAHAAAEAEILPPVALSDALPAHWALRTSVDAAEHHDDAPLMPQLAKPAPLAIEEPVPAAAAPIVPAEIATPTSSTVAVREEASLLERAIEHPLAAPAPVAVMEAPVAQPASPTVSEVAQLESVVLAAPVENEVFATVEHEAAAASVESVPSPVLRGLVEEGADDAASVVSVANVAPSNDSVDEGAIAAVEQPSVEVAAISGDQSSAEDSAGASVVARDSDESRSAEGGFAEQEVTEEASSSEEATATERASLENDGDDLPLEVSAPVVEVPVEDSSSVVERIFAEADRARVPTTIASSEPQIPSVVIPRAPEPVIPVPQYNIAQVDHAAHPIALPPQVVPFSTDSPAAYPQVAAVFTQPHARASEWLPWMRTSRWSRGQVRAATGSPAVEVTPNIHVAAHAAGAYIPLQAPVPTTLTKSMVPSALHPAPMASAPQPRLDIPPATLPILVPTPAAPRGDGRPVVVRIAQPAPPASIPIARVAPEVTLPQQVAATPVSIMTPSMRRVEAAEKIAEEIEVYTAAPEKSAEELRSEVAPLVHDSWDAAFLAGLE